jgi:SSS family solute:Na+ symporter
VVSTALALGITVVTLAVFSALGVWYSRGKVSSVEDFISARNTTGTGMTTATLIASGMGAWILFSPAETGTWYGLSAVAGYALGSAAPMLLYVFVGPRVRELIPAGHTLTEYAYARYGAAMYGYVLVVSVFYMFIFLAAEMTGITLALALVAGVPAWQTAGLIGAFVLVYTAYGGLKASIFTDTVQTLLILPLLAVGFAGAILALGGAGEIHAATAAANPSLLDPGFVPGLVYGFGLIVAVLGAEMLNQAWWQRIYAAKDTATLRRSFGVTALAVVPMVLLAGLFGVAAAGLGVLGEGEASIAFFVLLNTALPEWLVLLVVLLAVLLVMSTADTLFNAISSIVTADLPRLLDDPSEGVLTAGARLLTVVVALGATVIGAQGYSVLSLFLVADLLATATFVPLLYGLYSGDATGRGALLASVAGLAFGVAYDPTLRPLLTTLGVAGPLPTPDFVVGFTGALVISGVVVVVAGRVTGSHFDLGRLSSEVHSLDEGVPSDD